MTVVAADTLRAHTTCPVAVRGQRILVPPITSASVVVCTWSPERLGDLFACLDSLRFQHQPPDEVIVVVDHDDELLERVSSAVADRLGVTVLPNRHGRGLSGARNTGVDVARGDVVVFLDDDATAHQDWLDELLRPFAAPQVVAVGGRIEPAWPISRPWWFPEHLDWTVGCTNPGMPDEVTSVRNVFGASAAFRRDALVDIGGFATALGRVGADAAGCEETDVCIRLRQRRADAQVLYAPAAVVDHRVSATRCTVGYVWRRCRAEGRSKRRLATRVGAEATVEERRYARRILGVMGADVVGAVRRPARLGRAAVLGGAVVSTLVGYLAEGRAEGIDIIGPAGAR